MAHVLEVRDTRDGQIQGMKLLLPLSQGEEARTRFRREFRALSRLTHPNILRVFEWGLRGDRPWFTMELVQGHTLKVEAERLHEMRPEARYDRVRSLLVQVTRALAYIHDRGLIHRDVTPGNIMVRPDGIVKIMDFGVVKDLGADLTTVGEVVGTVAYIAPEQITGDQLDARADLYSLGAVLYLLLTGRRPFNAHTLQGYLDRHLHEVPKPPHEIDITVPPQLEEICLRLLAKAPADRYASAWHLLHILGDTEQEHTDRFPPQTVGRSVQKARIRDALDDLANLKRGSALWLGGATGVGKTRLLEIAEQYARRRGLTVATGRCRPSDRPFGAFIGVFRALAGEDPPPILQKVLGNKETAGVFERYPVISAFRDLLKRRTPAVVILDDFENADPATVELLDYLLRNLLELSAEPVVFIIGEETADGAADSRHLGPLPLIQRMPLGPLGPTDVEELVLSIIDNTPAARALAERLHRESKGSPAFIAEMLRGLLDEGLMVHDADKARATLTLEASDITRSRLPMPASVRQSIQERLAPLPPDALEVARVLAMVRRRLDLDTVIASAALPEDRVMQALDVLSDGELVVEARIEDMELVELGSGRVRDILIEQMDPDERRRRHQHLAEVLELRHRSHLLAVVEELAYHFEQAGIATKAYAYLVMTASKHHQRSLHAEAKAFLDRALTMEPVARPLMLLDHADRSLAEVWLHRSQAHYMLGRWTEALQDARKGEGIAQKVHDPKLLSRLHAEIGLQLRNLGDTPQCETALRQALDEAEKSGDQTLKPAPLYQLGALLWSRGDLPAAEKAWQETLDLALALGDTRAQGSGYNGLGVISICRGNAMEARRHLEQSARIFEELGMLGPLSVTRVNLAELYLSTGILRKALQVAEKTVGQAREVYHPHALALGLAWRAQVLLALGRWHDANQSAGEALRVMRQLGKSPEDEVVILGTVMRIALARGEPDQALESGRELLELLAPQDVEGYRAQVKAWTAQALVALDRIPEAKALLDGVTVDDKEWPHVRVRTAIALGQALATLGEPDRARPILEVALQSAEANGYRYFQLCAHQLLGALVTDDDAKARHARVAHQLARSLAASLAREDASTFLVQGLGLSPEA